jgi:hypothetical protein
MERINSSAALTANGEPAPRAESTGDVDFTEAFGQRVSHLICFLQSA